MFRCGEFDNQRRTSGASGQRGDVGTESVANSREAFREANRIGLRGTRVSRCFQFCAVTERNRRDKVVLLVCEAGSSRWNLSQHKPVCPFCKTMTTVSYSVSEVILASRARYNSLTESFSRCHDTITQVHRARFLTDVLTAACDRFVCPRVLAMRRDGASRWRSGQGSDRSCERLTGPRTGRNSQENRREGSVHAALLLMI